MNTITHVLPWIQLALSILLIILILIQRSAGGIEGGALGGNSTNMTYFARRGAERFIFTATIILAILFAVSAILPLLFK